MASIIHFAVTSSQSITATTPFPYANSEMETNNSTEANMQVPIRTAGTLSKLYVEVSSNTAVLANTFRTRINGGNGAQSVSITAGTTGLFEDTVNSDTISAGDLVNYQLTVNDSANTLRQASTIFTANSNTVKKHVAGNVAGQKVTNNGGRDHYVLAGVLRQETTEATTQFTCRSAGTLKNLFVYLSANSKTATSTFGTRIEGADGNLTISIAGAATGMFEDTTNSDTISSGNRINYSMLHGASAGSVTYRQMGVEFESTASEFYLLNGETNPGSINANLTRYLPPEGGINPSGTETARDSKTRMAFNVTNLACRIGVNSVTANSTLTFRANAGDVGTLSVSITASTTGVFEDTSGSGSIADQDLICYKLVTGATGTSLTPRWFSILATVGGAVAQTIYHTRMRMGYGT